MASVQHACTGRAPTRVQQVQHAPRAASGFVLGKPELVCRWRLSAGALPAQTRHLRALGRRMVAGAPLPKPLLAWAQQHIEWTLNPKTLAYPDGVLLLTIDKQAHAAMAAGPYQPLAKTSLNTLIERARAAELEAAETDVAPETMWCVCDSSLIVNIAVGEYASGAASLIFDLAATLGMPSERRGSLLDDICDGSQDFDEAFLVSDEHGVVVASDATGPRGTRFFEGWDKLLQSTHNVKRR